MGEVVKFEPPLTAEEEREGRECLGKLMKDCDEMERIDKGFGAIGTRNGMRSLEKGEDAIDALFKAMSASQLGPLSYDPNENKTE